MEKLINFFKHKGILATLIGLAIAAPVNIRMLYLFFTLPLDGKTEIPSGLLWIAAIMNGIAMVWFILPSVIIFKSKILEIRIED